MNILTYSRRVVAFASASAACTLLTAASAGAQTVTLAQSNATTLRGGSYASTNYSERPRHRNPRQQRSLLRAPRPAEVRYPHDHCRGGTSITSAKLTVTSPAATARAADSAYGVNSSYDEAAATWNSRNVIEPLVEGGRRPHRYAHRRR